MTFSLPIPPSINQTYGVSKAGLHGLYKKEAVKTWERSAGWTVKRQLMKLGTRKKYLPYLGNVRVEINWFFLKNRDIDSGIKILLDLFEDMGIYKNDMQITELNMKKEFDSKEPRVEVLIELC